MKRANRDTEKENDAFRIQHGNDVESKRSKHDDPIRTLHETMGNQAVQRLHGQDGRQLAVSKPSDAPEREAERVAKEVVGTSASDQVDKNNESPTDGTAGTNKASTNTNQQDSYSLPNGGRPLPVGTRSYFESRFGESFDDVHVHTGERAERMAQAINAKAFTVGRNIAFADGQYQPGTNPGKRLLAHELTHVVQQRSDDSGSLTDRGDSPVSHSVGYSSVIQRQGGPMETGKTVVEGLDTIEKLSKKGKQQNNFGYTTDHASRMADKPSPMDNEYSAKVFDIISYGETITTSATFRVHWQGNSKGEIGGAHVVPDADFSLGQGFSVLADSIDIDFTAMKILPQGDNLTRWPMRWTYEGWYDRSGLGNFYVRGKFDIDALGGFQIVEHTVRNKGLPAVGSPEDHISPGHNIYAKSVYKPKEHKQKVKEVGVTPIPDN